MKLFLINGFLGSGKTTAIQQAAVELLNQDIKVGVITNDQGVQLVDSQFIQSFNIPSREVTGGCFCCNYEYLDSSIQSLSETSHPEIIFAESVGSCADLISTVVNPLLKFHPQLEVVVSVFADARILPALFQDHSPFYNDKVHYIYKKQLEEADILVINKTDLISEIELDEIKKIVNKRYPDKKIRCQSSLNRKEIRQWLNGIMTLRPRKNRSSLDIDYDIYAEGEAKLGWLDGEVEIHTTGRNAVQTGYKLINEIYYPINKEKLPVGHLKFLLDDGEQQQKVSFTLLNQSKTPQKLELSQINSVNVFINARVQTEPEHLRAIVMNAINILKEQGGCDIRVKGMVAFKPGYPTPTHKILTSKVNAFTD